MQYGTIRMFVAFSIAVAMSVLVGYGDACAQDHDAVFSTDEGCKEAVPVEEPCEGLLIPFEQARDALNCIQIEVPKLKLDLEKEVALREIDRKEWAAKEAAYVVRIEELEGSLDDAMRLVESPTPSTCSNFYLWLGATAVSSVLLTAIVLNQGPW